MASHSNPIITTSGEIAPGLHHVDVMQYGMARVCSVFVLETADAAAVIDTGTSDDVRKIKRYLKKAGIPLSKITHIVPSHFHFDHFGGGWYLWKVVREQNPDVKILTTMPTIVQLQDASLHLRRAARTFGVDSVGQMEPLPDHAYELVDADVPLPVPWVADGRKFMLLGTPGHTADHVCPTVLAGDGRVPFMFLGEAAGTLFHSKKLVTFGTSMPPEFSYDSYVSSLGKIINRRPEIVGYCHFGVVKGIQNKMKILEENMEFTRFFRDFVKENYLKHGSARPVVEKFANEEAPKRTDWDAHHLLLNILVALVYGQLVDLGLKEPK